MLREINTRRADDPQPEVTSTDNERRPTMSKRKNRRLRGAALGAELNRQVKVVAKLVRDNAALQSRLHRAQTDGAREVFERICEGRRFREHFYEAMVREMAEKLGRARGSDIADKMRELEPLFAERQRFRDNLLKLSMANIQKNAWVEVDQPTVRFEVYLPPIQFNMATPF